MANTFGVVLGLDIYYISKWFKPCFEETLKIASPNGWLDCEMIWTNLQKSPYNIPAGMKNVIEKTLWLSLQLIMDRKLVMRFELARNICKETKTAWRKAQDNWSLENNSYILHNKRALEIESNMWIAMESLANSPQRLEIARYEALIRETYAEIEIALQKRDVADQKRFRALQGSELAKMQYKTAKTDLQKIRIGIWGLSNEILKKTQNIRSTKT